MSNIQRGKGRGKLNQEHNALNGGYNSLPNGGAHAPHMTTMPAHFTTPVVGLAGLTHGIASTEYDPRYSQTQHAPPSHPTIRLDSSAQLTQHFANNGQNSQVEVYTVHHPAPRPTYSQPQRFHPSTQQQSLQQPPIPPFQQSSYFPSQPPAYYYPPAQATQNQFYMPNMPGGGMMAPNEYEANALMMNNNMLMQTQQQGQMSTPMPRPADKAPPAREKKVLSIVNPETNEPLIIAAAASDKGTAKGKPVETESTTTDVTSDEIAKQVKKEFCSQMNNLMNADKEKENSIRAVTQAEDVKGNSYVKESSTVPPSKESTPAVEVVVPPIRETTPIVVTIASQSTIPAKESTPIKEATPAKEKTPTSEEEAPAPSAREHSVSALSPMDIIEESVSAEGRNQSALEYTDTDEIGSEAADAPTPDTEEDEKKRSDEEAEKKQQREAELDELFEKLRNRKDQVDLASMFYNREFLYCVRDIEKEFHRTNCPLTTKELENFGIDINSMPKNSERGRTNNFAPSWQPKGGGNRGGYSGRHSYDPNRMAGSGSGGMRNGGGSIGPGGGGNKNKKYVPRNSIDRPSQLERAPKLKTSENAWKPDRINPEDLDKEEVRLKALLKKVRSLMNKITPTTKVELIDEFLEYNVSSQPDQLRQIVDIIFDKAVEEPKFSPLYSEVCRKQVDKEVGKQNNQSLFRNALLNRAQQTFSNVAHSGLQEKREEIDNETDPKKKLALEIEFLEASNKFRRRKFGNITFIGHLFMQQLLSTRIVQWCLCELIKPENEVPTEIDEESIHCGVQLIETLGKKLDQAKDINGVQYLSSILAQLEKIMPICSNKIRFMIMNLMELRKNKWVPRNSADGPKKLSEIQEDIKKEEAAKQIQREDYDRRQGGQNRNQMRGVPPSRNSLDARGTAGKRLQAASSSRIVTTTAAPKNISLSKIDSKDEKKKNWQQGSGGGGQGSSNVQSIARPGTAKPGSVWSKNGSREGSESRKTSMVDERANAISAAKEIGKMPVQRTPSQTSVQSQEETEEMRQEREKANHKIVNTVDSDLAEYANGSCKIDEFSQGIIEMVGMDRYGSPDIRTVFHKFMQAAVEKVKEPLLPKMGEVLCHTLQTETIKKEALSGLASYCTYIIDTEGWVDFPQVWKKIAEVLINAINVPFDLFEGTRPTFNDFAEVFLEASKDNRNPYELLVTSLKRMAEFNRQHDEHEHKTMTSMAFEEMQFLDQLEDRARLDEALKACKPNFDEKISLFSLLSS